LVGFEKEKEALAGLGVKVIAASVDDAEKAGEVAAELSFPVGHGVTRADADAIGAWWEDRRQIIQPAEFLIGADGKVVASSYSDGPLGRIDAADVVRMVTRLESLKNK
jgi:peroxiredoxin